MIESVRPSHHGVAARGRTLSRRSSRVRRASAVQGVADRMSARVDVRRWGELGPAVRAEVDLPPSFVDLAMMEGTQQYAVVQAGRPTILP